MRDRRWRRWYTLPTHGFRFAELSVRGADADRGVRVSNRVPHTALENVTPYKAHGKNANLGHVRTIGARAFAHVETYTRMPQPKA